jgi:hypothetical protein
MKNKKTVWALGVAFVFGTGIVLALKGGFPFQSLDKGTEIPLPSPELKTNDDGVYSESRWTLDLMKYNFTMPPDNPEAPGDVFNPVFKGKTADRSPVIGEYTLQAGADRSINTMGARFNLSEDGNKESKVWIYRQTTRSDARLYNPTVLGARPDYLVATIDKDEPYGMYMMWVANASGAGLPVRVNAADATWIGPDHVQAGKEVSVYGRNLSNKNDTVLSYVYIRPWGAGRRTASRQVKVLRVNPYKVTFRLPAGLPADSDYEVWIHNGHGGKYGWAGPLKLHIDGRDPLAWPGKTIDVKTYGAKGDGKADDAAAIQAAIDAASDGDHIIFSEGTYRLVAKGLTSDKKLFFEGAANAVSTVTTDAEFKDTQMLFIRSFPSGISGLKFMTSKPDRQGLRILVRAEGPADGAQASGFTVERSVFETAAFGGNAMSVGYGINCVSAEHVNDVFIMANTFTTQVAVNAFDCDEVFIRNNKIYGNWKVTHGNGNLETSFPGSMHRMDLSENFFQGMDHTGDVKDGDRLLVRAIVFQNWHGGKHDRIYLGENRIERAGNPWDNSGEVILFEVPSPRNIAGLKLSGPTEMIMKEERKKNALIKQNVAIIRNTGIGQYRQVVANEGNRIVLDRPWDIEPDSTSRFSFNSSLDNCVIYKNTVIGIPNYYEQESATSGIQLYGACFNNVIADNTFRYLHHGIYVQGFTGHPTTDGHSTGSMGNLTVGNTISDVVYGLESIVVMYPYVMPKTRPLPEIPWSSNVNNVFRDNNVSNVRTFTVKGVEHGGYGIIVGQLYNDWQNPVWNGPWVREILVEHNTVTDAAGKYVWLRQHQEFTTVRKNDLIDTDRYPGTTGIYLSEESKNAIVTENAIGDKIDVKFGGKAPEFSIN